MTIKTILAPITGYEANEAGLVSGLRLARRLGAFVDFVHVRPDPRDLIPMLAEGAIGPVAAQMMDIAEKEAADHAAKAARLYEAACKKARASTGGIKAVAALDSVVGRAAEIVVQRARVADLVLFTRPAEAGEADWRITLEIALMDSGRPLLILPDKKMETIGDTIAIAWNGSAEAARAASAALPFLAKARKVRLLYGAKDKPIEPSVDAFGAWLARHRPKVEVKKVALRNWPVSDKLVGEAAHAGADLLVMGAYGHSRMRETIFGGATQAVLRAAALPVLLAH